MRIGRGGWWTSRMVRSDQIIGSRFARLTIYRARARFPGTDCSVAHIAPAFDELFCGGDLERLLRGAVSSTRSPTAPGLRVVPCSLQRGAVAPHGPNVPSTDDALLRPAGGRAARDYALLGPEDRALVDGVELRDGLRRLRLMAASAVVRLYADLEVAAPGADDAPPAWVLHRAVPLGAVPVPLGCRWFPLPAAHPADPDPIRGGHFVVRGRCMAVPMVERSAHNAVVARRTDGSSAGKPPPSLRYVKVTSERQPEGRRRWGEPSSLWHSSVMRLTLMRDGAVRAGVDRAMLDTPLVVLMRALGIDGVDDVVRLCAAWEQDDAAATDAARRRMKELLRPSFEEAESEAWAAVRVPRLPAARGAHRPGIAQPEQQQDVEMEMEMEIDDAPMPMPMPMPMPWLLPHCGGDVGEAARYVGHMVRRLLLSDASDCTDAIEFKRVRTAANLYAEVLRHSLRAMVSRSEARFLGKPKILTLNNKGAIIQVATDQAVGMQLNQSGGTTVTNQTSVAERVQTGLILKVTPQVNKDGYITMLVQPSYTNVTQSAISTASNPVYDPVSRGASALVRIHNGQTLVMGGLLQSTETKVVRKVPILGYIPIIGWLFTSSSDQRHNSDLVIFLTPTIVND